MGTSQANLANSSLTAFVDAEPTARSLIYSLELVRPVKPETFNILFKVAA